jgi:long-chain acyl-CoA synthetase
MKGRTAFQLVEEAAAAYGNSAALHQPYYEDGERKYRTYSWIEYRQIAQEIAVGLRVLGLSKGDIVAIDSLTRAEFYLIDLGILGSGCVSAALYPSYPAADLVAAIRASGAKTLVADNPETLSSLRAAEVSHRILLTGDEEGATSLDQLRRMGRSAIEADPEYFRRIQDEIEPADDAILYQTSGATGEPKMAMVSHGAVVANVDVGPLVLEVGPEDSTVAFLPSAHIAQRLVVEFMLIRMGVPVWFAESLLKLPHEIRAVRPTLLLAPPRVWERIYATICTEIRKRPALAQRVYHGALGLGLEAARRRQRGETVPAWLRASLKVADQLVFRKIRERFGGRLRFAISGAAPLGKQLAEFYDAVGMPVTEGYGLTEGGITIFNPANKARHGSIGKPLPRTEALIAEDGELLVRSAFSMSRYFQDPESTAGVFSDGWLHTGDFATMDDDGYIFIAGRKKELIISSTGKKVHPSRIENLFKLEALFSQVVLVGDRLPYVTALVTINLGMAETLKGMESYRGRPPQEIIDSPPVRKEVQEALKRINRQLAYFEQIRKYRVLSRDLSIEQGELTATMKVRRKRVLENFRSDIEELYEGHEL